MRADARVPLLTRVAHVTSVHAPDDVRIYHKEARSLSEAGYEVFVVAPLRSCCDLEGVNYVPVPASRNRLERFTLTQVRVFMRAMATGARVVHIHDPELIGTGFLLRLLGREVVYDAHEDLPLSVLSKYWIPRHLRPLVSRAAGFVEWLALRCLSAVVAATPSIARRFRSDRLVVVQNFPLVGELSRQSAQPFADRSATAVYIGGITPLRGARQMAHAFSLLPSQLDAELVLAGRIVSDELLQDLQQQAPGRVRFLGSVSRDAVADLLGDSRMGLVLFQPAPNHTEAQPNKLFEYMSAGLPVVASDFPLWREIVEGANCGIVVDPQDPVAIARAVQYLLEHPTEAEAMGRRGQDAVAERFNWAAEAGKLRRLYHNLVLPASPLDLAR